MNQKALFDFEADEAASGVRRVFGQIFFILSFIFLLIAAIWYVIPAVDTAIVPMFDIQTNHVKTVSHDSNGVPYITYVVDNDDHIVKAGEGAAEAYSRWEAENSVDMRMQFEPVWGGAAALGMTVLCMLAALSLAYRARIAFNSPKCFVIFGIIIVLLLGFISAPMLLFSVTTGAHESLPVWMPIAFGTVFGVIVGWAWWKQAKLSGICIRAGYLYDGGWDALGQRARTPVLYWIDKGEKTSEINYRAKQAYPVTDIAAWAEEDKKQWEIMVTGTASKAWLAFH